MIPQRFPRFVSEECSFLGVPTALIDRFCFACCSRGVARRLLYFGIERQDRFHVFRRRDPIGPLWFLG
jgi:hypothetical protein